MSKLSPEELVEQATSNGVFNIVNVLQDRAYPTDEVSIYLDEASAYQAAVTSERIEELEKELLVLPNSKEAADELKKLKSFIDKLAEKIEKSKYVFHITGISEGKREEIYDKATEKYPIEFSEEKNPFTGELKRSEIDNAERDKYFTNLIWQAHIEKIVNPEGAEQVSVSYDDIVALRDKLPLSEQGKINQAVEKIRNATAVFMYTVDEDFLAKS